MNDAHSYIPKDYYDVKQVDRRLVYSVIKPLHVFCDVGGGAGTDAMPLSLVASYGVCIDIDKTALKNGNMNSRVFGKKGKIDFVRASATYLPFRNDAFDVVTSFSVIDHLPNKKNAREAIEEFSRITRPLGYVIVTVPNKLFIVGTLLMKIKKIVEPTTFTYEVFEQRFTPKELGQYFSLFGLTILRYDSKNPTTVGITIIKNNIPIFFQKIPRNLMRPLLSLITRIFQFCETYLPLTLLGARFGCLGQNTI